MRFHALALAAALCLLSGAAAAQGVGAQPAPHVAPTPTLTLQAAWSLAETANPALRTRRAELIAAEAAVADAASLLNSNPQLSLDPTRRSVTQPAVGGERWNEWRGGITQTLEVAGQPARRREAAGAALQALRLEIEDALRQLHAQVAERFYRVLGLQQRAELEARALELFDRTARAVEKRRAAGEDTRLDANVALVEAERARNQLAAIQEQLIEARSALAAALQLPPAQLPKAAGSLEVAPPRYSREDLLESVHSQPRLQALSAREQSAVARLRLEQAARYPDLTVGVYAGREGPAVGRERLTTFTVSMPLPLFKRNAAGIGQAATNLAETRIERQATLRNLPAQVHALWLQLQSLQARVERLQRSVLPKLADNERLSVKSRAAGRIGLLELIVTSRQALDARRDLIDAQLDYQTTRLALEAAAGWSIRPQGNHP